MKIRRHHRLARLIREFNGAAIAVLAALALTACAEPDRAAPSGAIAKGVTQILQSAASPATAAASHAQRAGHS